MITRIFFPVGQGAFYAEKHDKFNMVYDCGNRWKTKKSQEVVRQSFTKDDIINILFISHLDYDHISLIKTLKDTVKSIERVVMPLLSSEQKILISATYGVDDADIYHMVNDPKVFFGNETKFTYIEPSGGKEFNPDENPILYNELSERIASGTKIKMGHNSANYNWCFIPFNIESKTRSKELECKLKKAGLNVSELKTDSLSTLRKLIDTKSKNKIKKIYESLNGDINENSLVVYSGPLDIKGKHRIRHFFSHCDLLFFDSLLQDGFFDLPFYRVACIFTGDVDLNKFNITTVFGSYWEVVGTVQIPHHGSLHSFNDGFLNSKGMFCPISFGVNNHYGHPSYDVVRKIITSRSYVINVTENMDSGYVQCIDI
ncbi:hypothetical protein ISO79_18975 [Morganella morganii subsp. morganii]|uniref:hypothetical protein n=1 Tax=Morganella morganii TaxID=582 RepID=UPI001BDAD541|nr:hypothetical protein [Morganella morganii]MBT0375794.1 hypothetical protein [Morganella morganii subsp. morganii]